MKTYEDWVAAGCPVYDPDHPLHRENEDEPVPGKDDEFFWPEDDE